MCGIAGGINLEVDLEKVREKLYHRGPDNEGIYKKKNIFLFHRRLAIQDIVHGNQPFYFPDKHNPKYIIVYNGEFYNHLEVRNNLLKEFRFKTKSDVETLLNLYIKYEINMFDHIDGMFSFAILDYDKNILFLARDRAGKKPLYYYTDKNKFFFASELNVFKLIDNIEIDEKAIISYLKLGFFPFTATPFKKVRALLQGNYLIVNLDDLTQTSSNYFNILDYYQKEKLKNNKGEIISLVEYNLKKSVRDRLLSSDLEVGAFLSGGIDSSLIVAFASEIIQKLKTFTVKFPEQYDESPLAKLTAEKYGTEHIEVEISMNLKDDIEKIIQNYGMPFMDSSAIPSYYVSKEAKKHLTVILNGDGADELFAGYRRYVPIANKLIRFSKSFKWFLKFIPPPKDKKSFYNYFYRLLFISGKNNLDFYLAATTDIFEDLYEFKKNSYLIEVESFIKKICNNNLLTDLSKFLYLDFSLILFSDLLVKMDIATMANSLEGRSPFLSKYFLEFAPRIPDEFKINKFKTKYILRELGKKYLHSELINQPKRGFEVPLKKWVNEDLKEMIFDLLKIGCYSENFINRRFIDGILQKKIIVSEEKRAKILWSMFCLEIWYKGFK